MDIPHYINLNYCTEYFYATKTALGVLHDPVLIVMSQMSILRNLFIALLLHDFIVLTKSRYIFDTILSCKIKLKRKYFSPKKCK